MVKQIACNDVVEGCAFKASAETGGESLYRGELAEKIVLFARQTGGALAAEDLAEHHSEWVRTLSQAWRGVTLHELPPNGQGLVVLIALGILKHLDIAHHRRFPLSPRTAAPSI